MNTKSFTDEVLDLAQGFGLPIDPSPNDNAEAIYGTLNANLGINLQMERFIRYCYLVDPVSRFYHATQANGQLKPGVKFPCGRAFTLLTRAEKMRLKTRLASSVRYGPPIFIYDRKRRRWFHDYKSYPSLDSALAFWERIKFNF